MLDKTDGLFSCPVPIGSAVVLGRQSISDQTNPLKLKLNLPYTEDGVSRSHASLLVDKTGNASLTVLPTVVNPLKVQYSNGKEELVQANATRRLQSGDVIILDGYNHPPLYSYTLRISASFTPTGASSTKQSADTQSGSSQVCDLN